MPYVSCVPTWSTCQRANVPNVPNTYQLLIFTCQCANVPKVCQLFNLACQCQKTCQFFILACHRAKRRANFSNILLTKCAKGNFHTLLLYKKFYIILAIIVIHMMCNVSHIKIVLYFISILHVILKKRVRNFCFLKLFCSSVKNQNTKKTGFYTLLVARIFLKSLSWNNVYVILVNIVIRVNIVIFLNSDLHELDIRNEYKKLYYNYISFRFLRLCFWVL